MLASQICTRQPGQGVEGGGAADTKKLIEVFQLCDEDKKGFLSREDLKVAVVMLFGYKPSKMEVDSMISVVHKNTAGVLLEPFLKCMSAKTRAQPTYGEIRHIFNAFDVHCRGFLTLDDFRRAFKHVVPHFADRIILEVFREVDQDSDGHVSYKDFECAVSYGQGEA
ncbi:EF-hand calcium-binding domain-containing protein 11 [Ambystoma mexicanum]|uniref:EF-hand calcium-binding domain-containing protein 11 n=1 Tax=Ambystoma mexicanum TaxID=8296 RepID=UPI0037E7AC5C